LIHNRHKHDNSVERYKSRSKRLVTDTTPKRAYANIQARIDFINQIQPCISSHSWVWLS
jgi:hypothetical protein